MAAGKRGMLTIDRLKARCVVDQASHCWLWQGATSGGLPKLWTLDYGRVEKRVMPGPLAAWHISRQAPPRDGHLVFRSCGHRACLNPAHLREMGSRAEIGLHIRRARSRVGTHVEARRRNIRAAMAATGVVPTPADVVRAIRAAPAEVTGLALAAQYGISHQTVSKIRRGESRMEVE